MMFLVGVIGFLVGCIFWYCMSKLDWSSWL